MRVELIEYAKNFINEKIKPDDFVNNYQKMWKVVRDDQKGIYSTEDNLSEAASSIFCWADMYNPEEDRDEDEIDAEQLKAKVIALLKEGGYL